MQYTIIGRIVDEMFDNKGECIVGYYVIDDNGKCNFGAVRKIYQLYQEGKIKGAKGFNEGNGEIDFANTDNSLLPKYSMTLFSGIGASGNICSVSENGGAYILKDASGQTKRFTEQDIVNSVKSGTIRLNNATVSNGTLSINKSISILGVQTKNGEQVGYKVALPNGVIKTFSKEEVIEKLIKEQGLQLFNAKIDGNGNIIAKSGTLPTKALDGIERADGMTYTDTFYLLFNNEVKAITAKGKYRGMLKNGKPHGKGTFTSQDYSIAFKGEYVDGVKQGEATLSWTDKANFGYKFSGTVANNYCEGKNCTLSYHHNLESLSYTYHGEFKKSRPSNGSIQFNDGESCSYSFDAEKGYGKLVKTDKSIQEKNYTYVGNFSVLGVPDGKGILTRSDGLKIECDNWELRLTNRLKSCKITFPNGDIFIGDIDIGCYICDKTREATTGNIYTNGKMSYSNGDVYTGQWKRNMQNGRGIMSYANGTTYTGMWKDGKPFGRGVYTFIKTVKGKKVKVTEYGIWDGTKKNNKVKVIKLLSKIYKNERIQGYTVSIDGVQKEMSCVELMTIDKTKYCVLNDCFDTLFYIQDMKIQAYQELSDDLVSSIPEPLVCIFPVPKAFGLRSGMDANNNIFFYSSDIESVADLRVVVKGKINRETDLILPRFDTFTDEQYMKVAFPFITAFNISGFSYSFFHFKTLLEKEYFYQFKKGLPCNFNTLGVCTAECKERYANYFADYCYGKSICNNIIQCDAKYNKSGDLCDLIVYASKNVDVLRAQRAKIYYKAFQGCTIDFCVFNDVGIFNEGMDIGEYFRNCHIHTLVIDGNIDVFNGLSDKERQAKYNYTIDDIISDDRLGLYIF